MQTGSAAGSADWPSFLVDFLPAAAAVVAAFIAARSAAKARATEAEMEKLRLLESRVSQRKQEVYQPIIDFLGSMLDPGEPKPSDKVVREKLGGFARWVAVVGSDEAVRAFRNLMQSTFHSAPAPILLRLYAEFQIAARKDLGDPDTEITPLDLIGMRINDLHTGKTGLYLAMTLPFEEACEAHDWEIPWGQVPSEREEAEKVSA